MPWLMKAEPDSRIVKDKDVKFSVDDFEKLGVSQWDGVRNHEAKKIMKERMRLGDQVLFYHSNCKIPGVFAIAEVAREGYPDYTAWDPKHPYFDLKTKKDDPTWFMVDVKFIKRLPSPPTLALIKQIASSPSIPKEISYIGEEGFQAIKSMQLVNRGRLSVQPVEQIAFDTIVELGTKGGWEDLVETKNSKSRTKVELTSISPPATKSEPNPEATSKVKGPKSNPRKRSQPIKDEDEGEEDKPMKEMEKPNKKAKIEKSTKEPIIGERRSQRIKK